MSTILDALRKVEENQRTRSADARAQLLSFPSRPSADAFRQQRTPWIIGAGLALAGFAVGAGLMFWGPHSQAPDKSQMASATATEVPLEKGSQPPVPTPAQPTSQSPVQTSPQLPGQALPQVTAEPPPPQPAPIPPQVEARLQVPLPQSPPFTPPPAASAPPAVPPVPQSAMSTLPSPMPPPSARAEMPVVSSPPTSAATPPAVRSAQAAPIPQLLNPQEAQRAARREARQARTAEHHNEASLDKLRELAAAAKAARGQPLPSPEAVQKALSEASAPRTATPKTKSSSLTSTAVTMPPNTSLSFLQWSPEPDRRLAFIKINGGPLTLAHEGDTVEGYTVVEIRRDAVELNAKGRSFTLQAEE